MRSLVALSAVLLLTTGCSKTDAEGSRSPTECVDNFDNDQDGLIDCADPDCCEIEACSLAPECTDTDTSSACDLHDELEEICGSTSGTTTTYGECNDTYCSALELDILVAYMTCDLAQENPCAVNDACSVEYAATATVSIECLYGIHGIDIDIGETSITETGSTTSYTVSECDELSINYDGVDEPVVGDTWTIWMTCDGALLMGPSGIQFEPLDFATVYNISITFQMEGTGLLMMQIGSYQAEMMIEVGAK